VEMSVQTMRAKAAELRRDLNAQDDHALAQLAARGSEDAMRLIIKRHNQRLFRVARGVLRDDAEAEDVVQETYVRAFSNLARFRGDARLSTWLTRIALNDALGRIRARRPSIDFDDADLIEGQMLMSPSTPIQTNPETEAARSHVRRVLEEAVDGLPETFRMVFLLRDVDGMSIEETAGCLAIQAQTVKTRLHRARRLLRTAIEKRLTASFHELFPFDGARCAHVADQVIERLRRTGYRA
jgi:RNA polymerase sigma-70 factor, ECF subfamily